MAKSQHTEIAQLEAAVHAALMSQSRGCMTERRARTSWAKVPAISALEGALWLTALPLVGIFLNRGAAHRV